MKRLVVGIGGITNGGKSTLSQSLHRLIPNSFIIAQDSYFKDDLIVPVDSNGFKQYDTLDALHMDKMMTDVDSWRTDPNSFLRQRGWNITPSSSNAEIFVLIVEGFLIFNYRPLNKLFDKRYLLEIPYEVCKRRRSSRLYNPPDPPGYFDGYVWPMYLKNRQEMERIASEIGDSSIKMKLENEAVTEHIIRISAFLDGLRPKEELLADVYKDICQEINRLQRKTEMI